MRITWLLAIAALAVHPACKRHHDVELTVSREGGCVGSVHYYLTPKDPPVTTSHEQPLVAYSKTVLRLERGTLVILSASGTTEHQAPLCRSLTCSVFVDGKPWRTKTSGSIVQCEGILGED